MKHVLTIDASIPQLHKLRKGRKVRVKHGKGVHLIVNPETYHLASRSFARGAGADIHLSEEELDHNLGLTPEEHQELSETHMTGGGIFGPKVDRWLEKRGLRDVAYELGDKIKPYAKAGAVGAITAGAAGLGALGTFGSGGTLAPLAPYLIPASAGLSALAVDYIDNPDKYHDTYRKVRHGNTLERSEETAKANDIINQHLGTNYDYMNIAGLQNAGANELSKKMTDASVRNRTRMKQRLSEGDNIQGSGLGTGVHHSRRKKLMEGGTIGLNGNHINYVPQALLSQPYTANFAMSHFLPPQYQHLNSGGLNSGGLGYTGSGLYAGGGMGCGIREDAEQAYDSVRRGAQDLYSNISPVVKNAFHSADQLMHGKGVKEDLRTVGETYLKYDPAYNIYKNRVNQLSKKIKNCRKNLMYKFRMHNDFFFGKINILFYSNRIIF
jgi:hypothetical protein